MTNGRKKGNDFENAVCKALSRWIDPSLPEKVKISALPFRRRSTSIVPIDGHWEGHGDILHRPDIGVSWPFCVECKKHEGWELDGILANEGWPIWTWWEQTQAQAARAKLLPLLIFTRNRRQLTVLIEERTAQCLQLKPASGPVLQVQRPSGERLTLLLLDDLVQVPVAKLRAASRLTTSSSTSRRRSTSRGATRERSTGR